MNIYNVWTLICLMCGTAAIVSALDMTWLESLGMGFATGCVAYEISR